MAKAGLEAALWDWEGKARGVSLAGLFGAARERIPVGVSIGLQPSTSALVERAGEYLEQGYKRIKIKIKPGKDLQLVIALRERFPDVLLQVDANSAYRLSDAGVFHEMDRYNLLLIEQPLSSDDIYQHSKLQRALQTPICLDESIHSAEDAEAALELGACRIINIKAGRVGGLAEAIKIHDLCLARSAPVWCGGMLETGIGRAGNVALAALPGFVLPGDISASRRYYREDLVEPEFEVDEQGTMAVPRGPGLGVTVMVERLRRVTTRTEEIQN
jgi:O-succinylbenzoate synthase